mmetsp:Transcript_16636/g.18627  ORF Transcript_16636/g.18627 Transcript_16636/m.18627 type:complete len:82 (-) Transcript_16636:630-875(-)
MTTTLETDVRHNQEWKDPSNTNVKRYTIPSPPCSILCALHHKENSQSIKIRHGHPKKITIKLNGSNYYHENVLSQEMFTIS